MNEKNDFEKSRTSTRKMLFYGSARLSSAMVLGIEGFALFTLYYVGYGVPAFLVTSAQAIGYLVIGLSQFLLGWISDAKYSRWGRRKPYIIIFTPLLAISFFSLVFPSLFVPDLNDKISLFLWFLIWDIGFKVGYSMTTVYQAWMPEQFEVRSRPKVSQIQNYFNYIGNAIMIVVSMLVLTSFVGQLEVDINAAIPTDYLIILVFFAIVLMVLFYLVAFLMPTEQYYEIKTNLVENIKTTVKNKNFELTILMIGLSSLAWSQISNVMLTYTQVVLDFSTTEYLIAAVLLIIGVFIFLYLWRKLIEKKGKKPTLLYILLFAMIYLPLTLVGLIPMSSTLVFGIIFIIGIAAMLGGWGLFPYIIYADLAEDDEKSTGNLKAGAYAGFPAIPLNAFQAFGVFVLGVAISSLPDVTVGTLTFSLGLVVWGPICSVFLLISYFYTRKYVKLDFDWEKTE
jgi:GPH family glycoside/pentoside/hexuronide:cation symporter